MASLKEQKEDFVTGFEGTSPQELLLICVASPTIALWLYRQVMSAVTSNSVVVAVLVEVLSVAVPMIICQSNLLYPWGVGYLGLQVLMASALRMTTSKTDPKQATSSAKKEVGADASPSLLDDNGLKKKAALTVYRSTMLYMTFVAILAVDFRVFPRRFVKTEVRGYSLMDLGAASFVVSAGFVSPRARRRKSDAISNNKRPSKSQLARMLPLVFMGLLRLVTHKGIDYQEHSSEYGVHWNFFFTLAMLTPTASWLPGPTWWAPIVLMGLYQYALSYHGVQSWVEQAPRTCVVVVDENESSNMANLVCDLFYANREGLLGCIGYSALYLAGEWIACLYFWHESASSLSLAGASLGVLAVWRLLVSPSLVGLDASRRTTNAVFCLWALFVSCAQLAAILFVYENEQTNKRATKQNHKQQPLLLHAANRNGLIVFVVANLLTGLVNISINTLEVSDGPALCILLAYLSAIAGVSVTVDLVNRFLVREAEPSKQHAS